MNNNKKNSWMLIIACFMLCVSVFYALSLEKSKDKMATSLGKSVFNVDFNDADVVSTSGIGNSESINVVGTSVNLEANLTLPGDSVTYDVKVENKGNVDAVLSSITHNMDALSEKYSNVTYEISGISVGDVLSSKEKCVFTVKFLVDENSSKVNFKDTLALTLNYEQK